MSAATPIQARAQGVRADAASRFADVASFTTAERKARGNGVNVYAIDCGTESWKHPQQLGNLVNPSLLPLSRGGRFLYSVHGDLDYASAFALDPASKYASFLNRASTGGRNGVEQAIDLSGKFTLVCNYASGSVSVLPIDANGKLRDQHQVVPLVGSPGPHRREQISSHPHNVVFDPSGRFIVVPDKGLNRIFMFRFDSTAGHRTLASSTAGRAGAGPGTCLLPDPRRAEGCQRTRQLPRNLRMGCERGDVEAA